MENLLYNLATKFINSLSLDFEYFNMSRSSLKEGRFEIEYDRLSLLIYNHNLSKQEYKLFVRLSREIYNKTVSDEVKKRVKEYSILLLFTIVNLKYRLLRIKAKIHPDFILYDDNDISYGIEITELTSPCDKVLTKILDEFSDCTSIENFKKQAILKHGNKARKYKYRKIKNNIFVASPLIDITSRKEDFANQILRKYKKYENMIDKFDEFIILCDARSGIEVDKSNDVREILDIVESKLQLKNVMVVILYTDGCGSLRCDTKKWV